MTKDNLMTRLSYPKLNDSVINRHGDLLGTILFVNENTDEIIVSLLTNQSVTVSSASLEQTSEHVFRLDWDLDIPESKESSEIDKLLEERGKRYGRFLGPSVISQNLKDEIHSGRSWEIMTADQREALDMIAHKIGRIVNGDPDYIDSWMDIIGYAQLIVNELNTYQSPVNHPSITHSKND